MLFPSTSKSCTYSRKAKEEAVKKEADVKVAATKMA